MSEHIDNKLREATPIQTGDAYERVFSRVMDKLGVAPVTSPYQAFFQRRLVTQTVAALLVVVVAMGGTVAVADAAKPGDWLFPVEQASESARLLVTPTTKKAALESQFLDERIAELKTIIETESSYGASSTEIDMLAQASEARIANAIETAVVQAKRLDEKDRPERLSKLLAMVNQMKPGKRAEFVSDMSQVRVEPERMEVRTEHERIRVEKKEQEVNMRYEWRDDHDKRDNDSRHGRWSDRVETVWQQTNDTDEESDYHDDAWEDWDDWSSDDHDEDNHNEGEEDRGDTSGHDGRHDEEENDEDSGDDDGDRDNSGHSSDDDQEEDD